MISKHFPLSRKNVSRHCQVSSERQNTCLPSPSGIFCFPAHFHVEYFVTSFSLHPSMPFYSLVTLVDTCIFNIHSTCVLGKYWVQTLSSRPAGLYILCYMFMAKTCICIDLKKKTPHKREWTTDNTLQMRWESLKKTQIKRTKCGKMNSLTLYLWGSTMCQGGRDTKMDATAQFIPQEGRDKQRAVTHPVRWLHTALSAEKEARGPHGRRIWNSSRLLQDAREGHSGPDIWA